MKTNQIVGLGLSLAALLLVDPLEATTLALLQDIDLSLVVVNSDGGLQNFGFTPVAIGDGDSVDITYNFLGGQRLTISTQASGASFLPAWPWLSLYDGTPGVFDIVNSTVDLLNPITTGAATTQATGGAEAGGTVHLGPFASFFLEPYSSVSFTGVRARFDVVDVPGGSNFYGAWFNLGVDEGAAVVATATSVPDGSASVVLLLVGVWGVGAARRFAVRSG